MLPYGHEVPQCRISVAMGGLGGGDSLVEGELPGCRSPRRRNSAGADGVTGLGLQAVGDDEGPGVDEGVAGNAVLILQLHQGVERVAGGFAAHVPPQLFALPGQTRARVKALVSSAWRTALPVPAAEHRAVEFGDGDAEAARIAGGERRDVVGRPPAARRLLDLGGDAFEDRLEGRRRRRDHYFASRSVLVRVVVQACAEPLPARTSGRSSSASRSAGNSPFSSTSSATPRPVARASLAMSVAAVYPMCGLSAVTIPMEFSTVARRVHGLAVMPTTQRSARVRQAAARCAMLRTGMQDDRLEGVELELAGLGSHGDGDVVADDLEGDLIDDLWNNRVDLAGHDARAGLTGGRLISLRPARGPEDSRRRSLQILESLTATRLSTPES